MSESQELAVVTLGECNCGNPKPHRRFYLGLVALTPGFFSVEEGKTLLANPRSDLYLTDDDRARLTVDLEASGLSAKGEEMLASSDEDEERLLPVMSDEEKIHSFSRTFGVYKPESLDEAIGQNVDDGRLDPALVERIRAKIKELSDEEKIDGAANFFVDTDLTVPSNTTILSEMILPVFLDRVLAGIRERQAIDDLGDLFSFLGISDND